MRTDPKAPRPLGELERLVMDQLWAADGALTVREVHDRLAETRELAYTTVMTVLDRLAKKKLTERERDGKAWRYRAAAPREELAADLMRDALDRAGDRREALVRFVGQVTDEEAALLREALTRLEATSPPSPPTAGAGSLSGEAAPRAAAHAVSSTGADGATGADDATGAAAHADGASSAAPAGRADGGGVRGRGRIGEAADG